MEKNHGQTVERPTHGHSHVHHMDGEDRTPMEVATDQQAPATLLPYRQTAGKGG